MSGLSDELRKMLLTPFHEVYEISDDGSIYVKPACLFGVPVARSGEGSPYWQSSWTSLNAYIAGEQNEEDLKRGAVRKLTVDPNNKAAQKEKKLHTDNVSKQRKIREVFGGNQRAHPNQLVAKRFLPLAGLCEQEIMYHIGCKMTDLQVLANAGYLSMDPWDFYRWRISRVLVDRQRGLLPGAKRDGTRSVINSLDSERGSDPVFREAVMYSARLQGRFAAYGSKKKPSAGYKQNGNVVAPRSPPHAMSKRSSSIFQKFGRPSTNTLAPTSVSALRSPPSRIDTDFVQRRRAAKEQSRAERRARAAEQSAGYGGVNAYRAQKEREKANETDHMECDSDDGKCSSSKF